MFSKSEVPFLSLDYYDYFGIQTTEDFSPTTTSSETDVATVLETTVATPVSTISTFLELQEEEEDRKTVDRFVVSSSSSTTSGIPSKRVIFPSDPILKARRQETTSWPPVKSTERNLYDLVVQPVVLPSWLRALEQKYESKRKGKNAGVEENIKSTIFSLDVASSSICYYSHQITVNCNVELLYYGHFLLLLNLRF